MAAAGGQNERMSIMRELCPAGRDDDSGSQQRRRARTRKQEWEEACLTIEPQGDYGSAEAGLRSQLMGHHQGETGLGRGLEEDVTVPFRVYLQWPCRV